MKKIKTSIIGSAIIIVVAHAIIFLSILKPMTVTAAQKNSCNKLYGSQKKRSTSPYYKPAITLSQIMKIEGWVELELYFTDGLGGRPKKVGRLKEYNFKKGNYDSSLSLLRNPFIVKLPNGDYRFITSDNRDTEAFQAILPPINRRIAIEWQASDVESDLVKNFVLRFNIYHSSHGGRYSDEFIPNFQGFPTEGTQAIKAIIDGSKNYYVVIGDKRIRLFSSKKQVDAGPFFETFGDEKFGYGGGEYIEPAVPIKY